MARPPAPARLPASETAVLAVDMQERLMAVMEEADALTSRASVLVEGALALGVPVARTEQAPEKLGATVVSPLTRTEALAATAEKTAFSACVDPVLEALKARERRCVVVAGIEAHVCVLQTALDLTSRGYAVAVALDAISSRHARDREAARERLVQAGVVPTTVESVLMEWVGDAAAPGFKAVLPWIK